MIKMVISFWTAFAMLFSSFVPGFVVADNVKSEKIYPYIFVHGFLGWGADEGIDGDIPYWGATACNLVDNLKEEGYECYDASVGPLSSNWDRACELYAQLTGTTVDYGVSHSNQNKHARYGRTYAEPLIANWGELDNDGLINKINLIGHSFGGNTIRLLADLLANGSQEEMAATSSDDISPLFIGGKSDWVNCVTTICSPNNGTTLAYVADELLLTKILETLAYTYAGIMGRSIINGYFDFHLEQFGLTAIPGEGGKSASFEKALRVMLEQEYDSAVYDLSPDGVKKLNDECALEDNVYYFSYAFSTTVQICDTGIYAPVPGTLPVIAPFAMMMGMFTKNRTTDFYIDSTWRENDGLVNLVSAKYPFGDPHVDYSADNIQTGTWNVMPVSRGDHGTAIGIGVSEEETMKYYNGMVDMINSLPVVS